MALLLRGLDVLNVGSDIWISVLPVRIDVLDVEIRVIR